MFELRKSFNFEASHVLTGHNGKCARFHGHSYVLTLILRGRRLKQSGPQRNMLMDFCEISAATKGLVASHLDHHHLNDTLATKSPTAEYIARWIYRRLAPQLAPQLVAVELRETASAVVVYRPSLATARRYAALAAAKAEDNASAMPVQNGGHSVLNGFATGSEDSGEDGEDAEDSEDASASEDDVFEAEGVIGARNALANGCRVSVSSPPCGAGAVVASEDMLTGSALSPGS